MACALSACADDSAQIDQTALVQSEASADSQPAEGEAASGGQSARGEGDRNGDGNGDGSIVNDPAPRSPIQAFFDVTPYNEERHRETEELIFVCMKGEGFDYVVTEFSSAESSPTGLPETSLEYGTVAYAEKYGFAISTTRFSQTSVGPDLLGYDAGRRTQPSTVDDPTAALDEAGQEAYSRALFGKPLSGGEDFNQGGCLGEAQRTLQEQDSYHEFANEFADAIAELHESIAKDSRLTELEEKMSACVASTGFDPQAFQNEAVAEVRAMGETHLFDALQLSSEELVELEQDEYWDAVRTMDNHPLSDQLRKELAALQASEIEVATAVAACDDFEVWDQTYDAVVQEYEEKFLAKNADRMLYYKAELEGSE